MQHRKNNNKQNPLEGNQSTCRCGTVEAAVSVTVCVCVKWTTPPPSAEAYRLSGVKSGNDNVSRSVSSGSPLLLSKRL